LDEVKKHSINVCQHFKLDILLLLVLQPLPPKYGVSRPSAMSVVLDDSNLSLECIFTEPPRPPTPKPTLALYTRDHRRVQGDSNTGADWRDIEIRLVGTHSLWGTTYGMPRVHLRRI